MPPQVSALHRTIVVIDVASFTDPARTTIHQLAVRKGLYDVLHTAFTEAGVDLSVCVVENRGDGTLILVPPDVAKSQVAEQLPSRLIAGLRRSNAVHSTEAAVQLRVALDAGEVSLDEHGAVGQAVNRAFRILEAPEAKVAQVIDRCARVDRLRCLLPRRDLPRPRRRTWLVPADLCVGQEDLDRGVATTARRFDARRPRARLAACHGVGAFARMAGRNHRPATPDAVTSSRRPRCASRAEGRKHEVEQ